MSDFTDRLWSLIPGVNRASDTSGHLQRFIQLPGEQLDEIKVLIDGIVANMDLDNCEDRFLTLLAVYLRASFNTGWTGAQKRAAIRDAVAQHKRRGTAGYLLNLLRAVGWDGAMYDSTLRPFAWDDENSLWNSAGLTGEEYAAGSYMLENWAGGIQSSTIRSVVASQHPAGFRVYYRQWMTTSVNMSDVIGAFVETDPIDTYVAIGDGDETFVDPASPPPPGEGQTELKHECYRKKAHAFVLVKPDDEGEYHFDGARYTVATGEEATHAALLFSIPRRDANGTIIKEYGFFADYGVGITNVPNFSKTADTEVNLCLLCFDDIP